MNNLKALAIALALTISPLAFAQDGIPNIKGTYQTKDKTASGEKLTLTLLDGTSMGRPGSYFALLLNNNLGRVDGYIIDPTESANVLGMTPVSVSRDGEVGVGDIKATLDENSYNPSLRITYGGIQKGTHVLGVSPAGKNSKGWVGQATFDKKGEIEWLPLPSGVFKGKKGCKITITNFGPDGNAQINSEKCREIPNPTYEVREKLPSRTYSLKSDILTNHGSEKPTMPDQVAFFVKKDGKTYMLLTTNELGNVQTAIELKK